MARTAGTNDRSDTSTWEVPTCTFDVAAIAACGCLYRLRLLQTCPTLAFTTAATGHRATSWMATAVNAEWRPDWTSGRQHTWGHEARQCPARHACAWASLATGTTVM